MGPKKKDKKAKKVEEAKVEESGMFVKLLNGSRLDLYDLYCDE
jgi:hypothetical protein